LVRQLACGYRLWGSLEATGLIGRDGGLDIRGVEVSACPTDSASEDGDSENDVDPIAEDREWRIQVKRYKEIGPKKMREIVEETVPAGLPPTPGGACEPSRR